LFVSGNVIGNLTMAPTARIFSKQTPFFWESYVHASPTIAGNNIVTAVAAGPGGTYLGGIDGYRLSLAGVGNQNNSLNWNLANVFDFSKDFELTADVYLNAGGGTATVGDGFIFNIGGSSSAGTTLAGNCINGSLNIWYNSYNGRLEMYSNATSLAANIGFGGNGPYYGIWMGEKIRVETIGGRRFLRYIHESGHALNSADVTFWNPAGSWLSITGKTGGATSTAYTTGMKLSYI
jgi:hypothetical protein